MFENTGVIRSFTGLQVVESPHLTWRDPAYMLNDRTLVVGDFQHFEIRLRVREYIEDKFAELAADVGLRGWKRR